MHEYATKRGYEIFGGLPSCLIGIEACATAHFWARQLLDLGHQSNSYPQPAGCGKGLETAFNIVLKDE